MWEPGGLQLVTLAEDLTVITEPDSGALRQISSRQCLADIIKLDHPGYQITFYAAIDSGARQVQGALLPTNGLIPFVSWIIENPDIASTNRLRVIEANGSLRITNLYTWSQPEQTWQFTGGNGLRHQSLSFAWNKEHTLHTESFRTFQPSGEKLVSQLASKYERFPWGENLVEEIAGIGDFSRTNAYIYWTQRGCPGFGRLAQLSRFDGYWEGYAYDYQGRLREKHLPFENSTKLHGRALTYDYSPWFSFGDQPWRFPGRPRTVTETIGGVVVAKRYFIARTDSTIEIQSALPSRRPFDSPCLCTTNHFYPPERGRLIQNELTATGGGNAGSPVSKVVELTAHFPETASDPNFGRLRSIEHPDGTIEIYSYHEDPKASTNVVLFGQPNAAHTDIVDGTETVFVLGPFGELLLQESYDVAPGRTNILVAREVYTYADTLRRSARVTYLDGTSATSQSACCGLESVQDRDGLVTLYTHDDLKRRSTESRLVDGTHPVITAYQYDGADHLIASVRFGTSGAELILLNGAAYDASGRARFLTNALGGVTMLNYGFDTAGRTLITNTLPNGGTRIEAYNRDGSVYQIMGTAVHAMRYNYWATNGTLATKQTRLDEQGQPTREWEADYADSLGRIFKTEYADGAYRQQFYNTKGQLFKERDPDGVVTLYGYNARGQRETVAVQTDSTDANDAMALGGTDRITRTIQDVAFNPALGAPVRRRLVYVWDEFHSSHSNLVSATETSLDGLKRWETVWNEGLATTNFTELAFGPGGDQTETLYAPDHSATVRYYRHGRLELTEALDATGATVTQTKYAYDEHNRLKRLADLRDGATLFGYNHADQLASITTPAPAPGQGPLTTITSYDQMLQPTNVVYPDQTSATTEYVMTGEIKKVYGARTFPVQYSCDYAGRVKSMKTWRNPKDASTVAVTTWNYNPYRGWLESKRYADDRGPDYDHTPSGKICRRTWARETAPGSGVRLATTYGYNPVGELASVTYNDTSTPTLTFNYNRRGQLTNVAQGRASVTLTWDNAGQMLSESHTSGPLAGVTLTNSYDQFLRRINLAVRHSGQKNPLIQQSFGYDTASRLQTVSGISITPPCSATYSYVTNSLLVKEITFRQGDSIRLTSAKQFDERDRLVSASATPANGSVASYDYSYNLANQPIQVGSADCGHWLYGYDPLGQLTRARKVVGDGRPTAGQQFEFDYDASGNRTATRTGANTQGLGLHSVRYTANGLNQCTGRAEEEFEYDADGNLIRDGRWAFTWDAENRLVSVVAVASNTTPGRLEFAYDWHNRRTVKRVWADHEGVGTPVQELKFVYDGWRLTGILNEKCEVLHSFAWGLDLSGTFDEAGSTGGLLMSWGADGAATNPADLTRGRGTRARAFFAAYDGHGNLTAFVNADDGKIGAQYEYGPFGEILASTGINSSSDHFGFATQYRDAETGFMYFGRRYYDPVTGRWLSRDPVNEPAFWSLSQTALDETDAAFGKTTFGAQDYVFLHNMPLGNVDLFGLASSCDEAVRQALDSRRNQRLLENIARSGCRPPRLAGSDDDSSCGCPGFLGEYFCPARRGNICCLNATSPAQIETAIHHELVHATDCCHNGLQTCQQRICSELVAYYLSDCAWMVNRLECTLNQMRSSMAGSARCAPAVSVSGEPTLRNCLRRWKQQQRE
jgi:RHS repeat-associated protein